MNLSELKNAIRYPDMTARQLAVLFVLHETKNRRLKEIALELQVPKPSLSRAFDALFRIGMIERVREQEDTRQVYGVLTDRGLEFLKGLM